MSKALSLYKDFFKDAPSLFNWKEDSFLKGFPEDISKVLNGKSDFVEWDDRYELEVELPGVKKDEVDIALNQDILTLSWSRKREEKGGLLKKKRYERSEGSFSRSYPVEGADVNSVTADLKEGILKITVPKLAKARAKKIEIN